MGNQQPRLFVLATQKEVVAILIEKQLIKLRVNRMSLEHYQNKGYKVEVNQTILVHAEDLTVNSAKTVRVLCDYCGEVIEKTYNKYIKQREIIKKDACFACFPQKQKEVYNTKHGVNSPFESQCVKQKIKTTNLLKYGVENVMQDITIHEKFKKTMQDKYGVDYAQQSPDIKEKTKQSMAIKFGVSHPMKNKEFRKGVGTGFVNGVRASKGQCEIAYLLNGSVNQNICGNFVDIVLNNHRIAIEYDGSGHDLSVKLGKTTQEDFNKKEKLRMIKILESGWKYFIIKNTKDKPLTMEHIQTIQKKIEEMVNLNYTIKEYIIS